MVKANSLLKYGLPRSRKRLLAMTDFRHSKLVVRQAKNPQRTKCVFLSKGNAYHAVIASEVRQHKRGVAIIGKLFVFAILEKA